MEKDRRLLLVLAASLVALAACATLAGIEEPRADGAANDVRDDGGGAPLADGLGVRPEKVTITTSCQGEGETKFVTLENQTERDVPYELQVPEGSAFALRDGNDASASLLKGTLRAREVVPVYLRVTETRAGTFDGPLIARLGDGVAQIPVTVTVNGGSLAFSPAIVDFGDVRYDQPSAASVVQIENTGTQRVNVIGFTAVTGADAGADFRLNSGGGSIPLDPGQTADVQAVMVPGEAGSQTSATFEPQTETPTCGARPTLTLRGTRVNDDVTVNPVLVDFGDVACGSTGATKTFTISNYSASPVSYTVKNDADARYVVTPTAGTVPPAAGSNAGTTTVTVTRKPPGAAIETYSDAIEVSFVGGADVKTTSVELKSKTVGAVLEVQPTALTNFGGGETKTFNVKNVGNKFVFLRHTSSNSSAFEIPSESRETPLQPGAAANVKVRFAASGNGQHNANVTTTRTSTPFLLQAIYPSSGQLCEPAPTVTATATK
ncbi:MAG: choice-of-anchor D domain-containing protein [Labilithrix sp.]|nr:choice-of-anchor D domain-containing protein [Labilithrix sp.]